MKKLLTVVILLLVAVLLIMTRPNEEAHKEAMMKAVKEYIDDEAENRGLGKNILVSLGKASIVGVVKTALNMKLKMNDYYLFNTTSVHVDGKDQTLSLGILGHVFTFDKDMLREKLEQATKAKDEEAALKEAEKANARAQKKAEREKRKREKQQAKEQKKRDKQIAKEQKQREKEAQKEAKRKEKEAKRKAKEAKRQNNG
ncbi:MAG: hypothetical protein IJP74_01415 [Prevotella sp.]|nr:hypothetical protein [Prevotella sp.]